MFPLADGDARGARAQLRPVHRVAHAADRAARRYRASRAPANGWSPAFARCSPSSAAPWRWPRASCCGRTSSRSACCRKCATPSPHRDAMPPRCCPICSARRRSHHGGACPPRGRHRQQRSGGIDQPRPGSSVRSGLAGRIAGGHADRCGAAPLRRSHDRDHARPDHADRAAATGLARLARLDRSIEQPRSRRVARSSSRDRSRHRGGLPHRPSVRADRRGVGAAARLRYPAKRTWGQE